MTGAESNATQSGTKFMRFDFIGLHQPDPTTNQIMPTLMKRVGRQLKQAMDLKKPALIALGFLFACKKESSERRETPAVSPPPAQLSSSGSGELHRRESSNSADRQLALARKKEDTRLQELEIAARKDWKTNPVLTLERIRQLPYPEFNSADEATQKRICDMARFVGEFPGLAVAERFECMFRMLPLKYTTVVVDDSIRILNQTEVREAASWLLKLEPSDQRSELLTLIGQRMKNLEMPPSEIQQWAESISDEAERLKVFKYLELRAIELK